MIAMRTDRLVDDYLRRLEAAAAGLPRVRRAELVEEIREHIDDALLELGATDEVAIRNVLERLGPPEEIAAEAAGPAAPHELADVSPGRLETAAIIVLALGFLVPIVGWLTGVVLVLVSRVWTTREKVIGVLFGVLPIVLPALVFIVGYSTEVSTSGIPVGEEPRSTDDDALGAALPLLVWGLSGMPSAVYLGWRLRRRRRA